jgi:hypothetical protein
MFVTTKFLQSRRKKEQMKMKKITEYGLKAQENFLEKCKQDGTYQRVYEQHEDGLCILEESIKTLQDAVAWCLLSYDTYAIVGINDCISDGTDLKAWGFELEHIKAELEKCIAEQ